MKRVLAVRQDNNGDVMLIGPALRAVATQASVSLLCGPRGAAAAGLMPGVSDVIVWEAAWIDAEPRTVCADDVGGFVADVRDRRFDEAIIFTSFHQSPLPTALLLRMANVPRVGAISVDYPGSLLDVRHFVHDDMHEVERALSLANAMHYTLPPKDDGRLAICNVPAETKIGVSDYVVVHPGATVPARAWSPERNAELVRRLAFEGRDVIVTGSACERALTAFVAGQNVGAIDLGGETSFAEFAAIVRDASVVVTGNTSAAHVAAATQTPVVSIFPPTIPALRFRPWMVEHILLGDQEAPCAGCRARACPIEGQPCLSNVTVDVVLNALQRYLRTKEVA